MSFRACNGCIPPILNVDTLMDPKLRKNYLLTNVKGIFGHLIAEYVMGYAIQYQRDFRLYQTQQAERLWQPRLTLHLPIKP